MYWYKKFDKRVGELRKMVYIYIYIIDIYLNIQNKKTSEKKKKTDQVQKQIHSSFCQIFFNKTGINFKKS